MIPEEPQPPLEKDVLEDPIRNEEKPLVEVPLSEKNFIANQPFLKTLPFWLWLFLAAILVALGLGMHSWYNQTIKTEKSHEPFMEVTNREFSVFLWQFPSYIRKNLTKKTGYLPGFYIDRENFDPLKGEEFVSAPPDLLFLYHTWKRLLVPNLKINSIKPSEFSVFLTQLTEWQPENWQQAPAAYAQLIASKSYLSQTDMRTLAEDQFPLIVKQAFQGWKNYFYEGPAINALNPTVNETKIFLKNNPGYSRPGWRNIDKIAGQPVAGKNYLRLLLDTKTSGQESIPADQLTPFLKVGLINAKN